MSKSLTDYLKVQFDRRIHTAITKIGEDNLRRAFQRYSFIYGTCGGGSTVGRAANLFLQRGNNPARGAASKFLGKINRKPRTVYDPGMRASEYIKGNMQMMDCYFGPPDSELHQVRDHVIGEYVHMAMGFKGHYNRNKSGRDTYIATFPERDSQGNYVEGWSQPRTGKTEWDGYHYPDPDNLEYGLSGTKEMSRIIRFGIFYFGGKLIFEGANVAWHDVFIAKTKDEVKNTFFRGVISDTGREGIALMKHFVASTETTGADVKHGNGRLIFNWRGKKIEPTKALFKANWNYAAPHEYTASQEDSTMRSEFNRFRGGSNTSA